jgi:hypothetical protein
VAGIAQRGGCAHEFIERRVRSARADLFNGEVLPVVHGLLQRPVAVPDPSSLSGSGLIYCDNGKSVHFYDPFRQIATAILLKRSKNWPRFPMCLATIT